MKEIFHLAVTQVRIFPVDIVGFNSLKRSHSIDQIRDKYNLEVVSQFPDELPIELSMIRFKNGEYEFEQNNYLVTNVQIEERRILITINALSNVASEFYKDLIELLTSLDLRAQKPAYDHLVFAQETACIAKLDFSMRDIFESSHIKNFDNLIAEKIQQKDTRLLVYPSSIRFRIKYLDIPDKLKKNKISLSDKDFLLEVRERTDPEDQVFLSTSPTDSETHLSILAELENIIAKSHV